VIGSGLFHSLHLAFPAANANTPCTPSVTGIAHCWVFVEVPKMVFVNFY